ncbi:hypothetical protein StoSoilB13_30090 (plasmid) [Arthrobacter sp. StoSoilB13]|nr:hypothetical protein StoSoilB13_30090 [Arthrobacter sp. StoSoilB13]
MRFILRRLGFYLIAFWASITLNFLLPRFMPGDPVSRMFARSQDRMQPEQIEALRKLLGVDDRPIWEQYVDYMHNIFTGQMGVSISRFPTPVTEVISSQIGWTLLLGGTALVIAAVVGNLLGILAAWRRGGAIDSALPPVLVFIGSFPYFWLAMGALYLFGVVLGWFPIRHAFTDGLEPGFTWEFIGDVGAHLVLPALTIVLVSIGGWMLGMRNTMIATNSEDYITMAEAKGLRARAASCSATQPGTRCCPRSRASAWDWVSWWAVRCSPRWCSRTPAWATNSSTPSKAWTTPSCRACS